MPLFIKINKMIEIFGKFIFGSCAEQWLTLCKENKIKWILKNTNQTDSNLINDFINNPKISKECKCLDCGKNGNKRKTISTEVATDTKQIDNRAISERNSTKRPRATKRAKN